MMKKLGFGLMRLPMLGDEVDIETLKKMVDLYLERGFTYFDTAWGYTGGKSEMAVKQVLTHRHPRDSYQLATKLPAWAGAKTAEEARAMLQTSLERTGAEYFDYYLLHNIGGERTKIFDKFGLWEYLAEKKRKGIIRNLGFSIHDSAESLDRILTEHPETDFVQLQINYADWESASVQSRLCYETARAHQKPVIVMEPVKGGLLASLPASVTEPMRRFAPERSLASWAIRYAASLEGVLTVLSGMSTPEQVADNTGYMMNFEPLSVEEQAVINEVQNRLANMQRIPCTDCRYCVKGCPKGVKIPQTFAAMNTYKVYGNLDEAKNRYRMYTEEGGGAHECIACGQCESVCPQHISIVDELSGALQLLQKK